VIGFSVGIALLLHSDLGLFVGHADFVKQNVRDFSLFQPCYIALTLEHVDVANSVGWSRLVNCEHILDELTVHEVVHIEDVLECRKVLNCAPWVWPIIGDHRPSRFLFCFSFCLVAFQNYFFFDMVQHSLVLAEVKDL